MFPDSLHFRKMSPEFDLSKSAESNPAETEKTFFSRIICHGDSGIPEGMCKTAEKIHEKEQVMQSLDKMTQPAAVCPNHLKMISQGTGYDGITDIPEF